MRVKVKQKMESSKLTQLFERFIKQRKNLEGNSIKTIENLTNNFELLKSFKSDVEPKDLTPEFIVDFFTYLDERERKVGNKLVIRKLQPSSIETVRAKLSAFFDWLVDNSYLSKNPFDKITHSVVSYSKREAFTNEEYDKIYLGVSRNIIWENLLLKKRNLTIIMFLALTGVRKEELIGLLLSDLDLKNKILTVRAEISKSKITRFVPLDGSLLIQLEEYLDARKNYTTPFLWVSSTTDRNFTEFGAKHLVERLEKATALKCHLHRFRHTFAVNHYMANKDLLALQRIMGHKSVKTTIVTYLRWLPDTQSQSQLNALRASLNQGN